MKQLVINAGIAAATSIAFTALAPIPEAQAMELTPSNFGTLAFGSRDGGASELRELNIIEPFASANVVEAGEFLMNETRGYFEYDLTAFEDDLFSPFFLDFEYTVSFGVFSDGGTGSAGSAGGGSNFGNPFDGIIRASWYLGSAFDPVVFDPLLGPESGACPTTIDIGLGGCDNPLAEIDMSEFSAGDTIELDISNLVKELLLANQGSFGIMLQAIAKDGTTLGACGGTGRACEGVTFTSSLREVPTPAAILPTLFGLASAAFGKKREQEEVEA